MTAEMMDNLEAQLAQLTEWDGESPQVWRNALDAAESGDVSSPSVIGRILTMPLSKLAVAAAIIVLASSALAVLVLPNLSRARSAGNAGAYRIQQSMDDYSGVRELAAPALGVSSDWNARQLRVTDDNFSDYLVHGGANLPAGGSGGGVGGSDPRELQDSSPLSMNRSVIRKADITLLVEDARAAFLRTSMLINEATGEYVEDSSLTENRGRPEAMVKLRVAADRLSDVMNALRELGEVKAEQMRGDDVTEQIIDLDARLRNEQRFEQEMLELLDTRSDAPLKEVLELRDRISNVRQQIEQLQARQQQLGRMVALATILVVLNEEEPKEPEVEEEDDDPTLGEYFTDAISGSWTTGLEFLADTIALLVRVLVGGLIWWLIAIAALIAARRMAQRRIATAAA